MEKLKVLELFAGIGACSSALDRLGIDYDIVDAVDIDKYAVKSFNAIHNTNFGVQDITTWDKDLDVDLIMHGSPCQDFSVAGKQAGGDEGSGTRSSLMYETIRIVEKLKPKYVVWENVKNLISKKHKHNFDAYIETMDNLGYVSYYKVLNAKDYGIPQNRERVYTVSIRRDLADSFRFPDEKELEILPKDMIEENVDEKYYLDENSLKNYDREFGSKGKQLSLFDPVPTLTASMGTGGGNIPYFEFPPKQELKLKLKDMLDKEVDEKYYLSDKIVDKIMHSSFNQERTRIQGTDVCDTLLARDYKDPKCVEVNRMYGIFDTETSTHQAGSVYDEEGLSPTLDTMQGGYRQPCVEVKDSKNYIDIKTPVRVRKYPVDTENLKKLLRWSKDKTNKEIAEAIDVPVTTVEHYFRTDDCFAIPDPEVWPKLKEVLNIKTDEFDESIMTFEERDGVYDKANRCYKEDGIAPTLTSASADEKVLVKDTIKKIINSDAKHQQDLVQTDEGVCRCIPAGTHGSTPHLLKTIVDDNSTYVEEKYKDFVDENGYIPEMFNPYNKQEIKDVAPTQTTQCGSTTSSAAVLKKEEPHIEVIGNYSPSNHDASRIVSPEGIAPTVKENHGTVTATLVEDNKNSKSLGNKSLRETLDSNNIDNVEDVAYIDGYNRKIRQDGLSNTITTRVSASNNDYLLIKDECNEDNIKLRKDTENYIEWEDGKNIQMHCRAFKEDKISSAILSDGGSMVLTGNEEVEYERTPLKFLNRNQKNIEGDYAFCVDSCNTGGVKEIQGDRFRIRKLTPKECWRLMGFTDEEYAKAEAVNSNSQLYKQAGNSIVVTVLVEIFKILLKEYIEYKKEEKEKKEKQTNENKEDKENGKNEN